MSAELVLFLVVAIVAIFSAASMLVSRNAVHSALFLVVNFLCVAFFYLMLNAPFLAAIQVTVYAGAIMVLFMFVIMLLGADKLGGQIGKFPWVAPVAVGVTTVILLISYWAISQSQVGLLKPVAPAPRISFLHAIPDAPAVDLYLNDLKVASNVSFEAAQPFVEAKAGDYNLLVFAACTEVDATKCADPIATGAAPVAAVPAKLESGKSIKFIIGGSLTTGVQLIPVDLDLTTLADDNTTRVTVVNALNGEAVTVTELLPPQQAGIFDQNRSTSPKITAERTANFAENLAFGAVSETKVVPVGTYEFAFARGTERITVLRDMLFKPKTHELLVLAPGLTAGDTVLRPTVIRFADAPIRTAEAFGSPQQIGLELLGPFVLPFELVSLLLLAALVGAIMLTREETVKRSRERLVVSPAIRHMNRRIAETTKGAEIPGAVSASSAGAETSAD